MKNVFFLFLISILFLVGGVSAQQKKDSTTIESMIEDWNTSWNTKDFRLAAKWYSDDARFINAFGHVRHGRNEVEALLKEVFSLAFVMTGKSEVVSQTHQRLSADVILVNTIVERKGQTMPDGTAIEKRQTHHLRVFHRQKGEWRIVSHLISDSRDRQSTQH
jgi:uncharacterized protein (TIGR02246 family)